MRKFKVILFVITLILNFSIVLQAESFHKVKLLKISDGDTFVVWDNGKKIKLRLLYIDTPEKYSSKKLTKDARACGVSKKRMRKLGMLATKYAKSYFRGQKYIMVSYKGKGYYKRTLAVVKRINKDTTYNSDIVRDGYSCIYRKAHYPDSYSKLLNLARKAGKGLWSVNYKVMQCLCGL